MSTVTGLSPRDGKKDKKGYRLEQTPGQAEAGPNPFPGGRLARLTLDGEWVLEETPSLEQLARHARKYGCNRVAETAVELGYGLEQVTQLIGVLDTIAPEHSKSHHHITTWQGYMQRKASPDDMALRLMGRKRCDDCRGKQGKVENCETCEGLGHVLRASNVKHDEVPTDAEGLPDDGQDPEEDE